ncbi:MAG: type I glutamate--ammonia ligase [Anaerolineaceae bacterium]|nr:MAG: type I glutamate--ammonia ligase [Anaerolineaceae bacterium]
MSQQTAILQTIEREGVQFIDLWFTDILGIVKSVTIPASQLEGVIAHGSHFDGSSIDGFARVAESDMELHPDLNTFRLLPWSAGETRTARLICNAHNTQGEPFIGDPRNALIRVIKQAEEAGYRFKVGMEMEFFLFRRRENGQQGVEPTEEASYFDMPPEPMQNIRRQMVRVMDALDIRTHAIHSEIARGQHEFEFAYDDALTIADAMLTARVAIKTVAQQHGLFCTFMPRPITDQPGSGLHTHQSLHDIHTDDNIFSDSEQEYGLSDIARYFLAGQLHHARAMTAILAPLVNSYKRLGKSFEAPTYVTWAHVNRAALIRVPRPQPGREDHTRLELRCPDPSCNPYLAIAVMLKAGLDGIQQKMTLQEPFEETILGQKRSRLRNAAHLPTTLGDALDALREDDVILDALGPYISDRFLEAKQQEFDQYNQIVTRWELDQYLGKY